MAEHPPPREQAIEYHREPKAAAKLTAKVRHPHQWYLTHRGSWRCRQCWREKWQDESQQNFEPCGSVDGTMKQLGICAPFHKLTAAVVDGGPELIIWCRVCGGFAENRACKLAGPTCKATSWTRRSLRRLELGFHPTRNAALRDLWDLSQAKGTQHYGEDAQAWAEDQVPHSSELKQQKDRVVGIDTGPAAVTSSLVDLLQEAEEGVLARKGAPAHELDCEDASTAAGMAEEGKLARQGAPAHELESEDAGKAAGIRRRMNKKARCSTPNAAEGQAQAQDDLALAKRRPLAQEVLPQQSAHRALHPGSTGTKRGTLEEEWEAAVQVAAPQQRGGSAKRRLTSKAPCIGNAAQLQQSG